MSINIQIFATLYRQMQRVGAAIGPLIMETVNKFQQTQVPLLSAALAYFALFSLFPLLLVIPVLIFR